MLVEERASIDGFDLYSAAVVVNEQIGLSQAPPEVDAVTPEPTVAEQNDAALAAIAGQMSKFGGLIR
jgi:hypothetical protein